MKKSRILLILLPLLLTSCEFISGLGGGGKKPSGIFDFYAVNDFHGSILERNGYYYEAGMTKLGGYLKTQKAARPDNTIILCSGDAWQGSLESNDNYGACITECMNDIGFDAFILGNHDFDYGKERLIKNIQDSNFPFLAGNIVKYQRQTERWEYVDISTIVERGGAKIGIVGMIGEGQTTSITSKHVADLAFVDPSTLAQNEAKRLKEQEKCDIVVLDIHDRPTEQMSWATKEYFDAVFGGHTHSAENTISNDVPYIQYYCNGEGVAKVSLELKDGKVTTVEHTHVRASYSWKADAGLQSIINKYIGTNEFREKSTRVCGYLSDSLNADEVGDLGARAAYEFYKQQYPNLSFAITNGQRASIGPGSIDFSSLYKATPFTNNIVVFKAKGTDLVKVAGWDWVRTYTGNPGKYSTINATQYYDVAVIDYLAYHMNESKRYNYFSSFNEDYILGEYETYPADLTFDYLNSLPNKNSLSRSSLLSDPGYNITVTATR